MRVLTLLAISTDITHRCGGAQPTCRHLALKLAERAMLAGKVFEEGENIATDSVKAAEPRSAPHDAAGAAALEGRAELGVVVDLGEQRAELVARVALRQHALR